MLLMLLLLLLTLPLLTLSFSLLSMHDNSLIQPDAPASWAESLTNCTIIATGSGWNYANLPSGGKGHAEVHCNSSAQMAKQVTMGHNTLYTDGGEVSITCGPNHGAGTGTYTLKEWQALGHDKGSTLTKKLPSDAEIEQLVRDWLKF